MAVARRGALAAASRIAIALGSRLRAARARRDDRASTPEARGDAWLEPLLLAAATLATFAVRWLALPRAFFHQNGQGPAWVAAALEASATSYGPGYAELFGWIAARAPDAPEAAVFLVDAALSATVPALVYLAARRAGAAGVVAAAAAFALAVTPVAGRVAQSESYFAAIAWLASVATLALVDAAREDVGPAAYTLDVAVAALVVAQAARVHPLGWIALALTPTAMLVREGSRALARRRAVVAGAAIAVVVATTSGGAMIRVLDGELGARWMPATTRALGLGRAAAIGALLVALVVALLAAERARGPRRDLAGPYAAAIALVVVAIATTTSLLGADTLAVREAYALLVAPTIAVLVALAAPFVADLARPRRISAHAIAALALGAAALIHASAVARSTCALPTDARELAWLVALRPSLDPAVGVARLGRAGRRVLELPRLGRGARRPIDAAEPRAPRLPAGTYWYRSSLCATPEGHAACEAVEREHALVEVARATLPGHASQPWLPFPTASVEVALLRVER